jgi:hypothetical protein
MDNRKFEPDRKEGNPNEVFREEMNNEGNMFTDTPTEADARDKAKVQKALSGESQKMDTVHPDELDDDDMDDITRETLENK